MFARARTNEVFHIEREIFGVWSNLEHDGTRVLNTRIDLLVYERAVLVYFVGTSRIKSVIVRSVVCILKLPIVVLYRSWFCAAVGESNSTSTKLPS